MGETLRLLATSLFPLLKGGTLRYTILELTLGFADIECPVHASNASLWVTIQSTFPSNSMTPKVVLGEFVDIRHVSGEVEDICNQQFFDI